MMEHFLELAGRRYEVYTVILREYSRVEHSVVVHSIICGIVDFEDFCSEEHIQNIGAMRWARCKELKSSGGETRN